MWRGPASGKLGARMATTLNERVRARLRHLRFERQLSVRALAERAGLSPSMLSRLERGHRRLTLEHVERLAAALSVAPRMLLGSDSAQPDPATDGRTWTPIGPERTQGRRVYRVRIAAEDVASHQHSHEGYQWLYVLDGTVILIVETERMVLGPGEAVAYDTWRPHALSALDGPAEMLVIFDPEGTPLRARQPGTAS